MPSENKVIWKLIFISLPESIESSHMFFDGLACCVVVQGVVKSHSEKLWDGVCCMLMGVLCKIYTFELLLLNPHGHTIQQSISQGSTHYALPKQAETQQLLNRVSIYHP